MSSNETPLLIDVRRIRPSGGSGNGREITIPDVFFNESYGLELGMYLSFLYVPSTGDIILRKRPNV